MRIQLGVYRKQSSFCNEVFFDIGLPSRKASAACVWQSFCRTEVSFQRTIESNNSPACIPFAAKYEKPTRVWECLYALIDFTNKQILQDVTINKFTIVRITKMSYYFEKTVKYTEYTYNTEYGFFE